MTERTCARKGCGKRPKPGATYCSKACSVAAQKERGGTFYTTKSAAAVGAARRMGLTLQEYYVQADRARLSAKKGEG